MDRLSGTKQSGGKPPHPKGRKLLFIVAVWTGIGAAALADEPPHWEFVNRLKERGDYPLALEYLQRLQQRRQPPLPEQVKSLLPFELGRAGAEVAAKERDAVRREQLLRQARADLESFLRDHAKHAQRAEAQLDLAKVIMEQGRRRLFRAQYEAADKPTRRRLREEARKFFEDADKVFVDATKGLKNRVDESLARDPQKKPPLLSTYLSAIYLHGLTRYEKGTSYDETTIEARGKTLQQAIDILEPLIEGARGEYRDQAIAWQGLALAGRCEEEQDKLQESKQIYDSIIRERSPAAAAGHQMVRYYRFLSAARTGAVAGRSAGRTALHRFGEDWLNDYRAAFNTREGRHLRFVLAGAYLDEIRAVDKTKLQTAENRQIMRRAGELYEELEHGRNEYSTLAADGKLLVRMLSGDASKPVEELALFEDCYVRAHMERRSATEVAANAAKARNENDEEKFEKLKAQAGDHYRTMLAAARRCLTLIPSNVTDDQWEGAYTLLFIAYSQTGDLLRAAVVAEFLARHPRTRPESALKAAISALEMYQLSLRRSNNPTDMQRLSAVAEMLEKKWPDAPETDQARDIIALVLFRQGKYRDAAAVWEKVSARYRNYPSVNYLTGLAFWNVHVAEVVRQGQKPLTAKSPERDKAIANLEKSIQGFQAVPQADPPTQVEAYLLLAELYGLLEQPEKAVALADSLVKRLEKNELPGDLPAKTKTRILGLALRANIQQKKTERATEILGLLQKQQGSELDLGGGWSKILMDLGVQIRNHLDALARQGPAARDQLKQTKDSFLQFLLYLDKDRAKLPPELQIWLGNNYLVVDEPAQAAEVFAGIADPGAQADPQKLERFRAARLLRIRALRQAKKFRVAEQEFTNLMKDEWARRHPEFLKEQIHLVQDQGRYSAAITQWGQLIRALQPHLEKSSVVKDAYYEANFQLLVCQYQEAVKIKDSATRVEGIRRAAQSAALLQKNDFGGPSHQRRFEDFVAKHGDFRKEFEKLNNRK